MNECTLGMGSFIPGGSCSCRHGKGILTEAAFFLCLVLTGLQPLLLSLQMLLLPEHLPCADISLLPDRNPAKPAEEKKNRIQTFDPPIQTSQRCKNRETDFECDLCADVTCSCLSSLCVCQGHEMTLEPFVGPFSCLAGRK